jgi:guanylate cyclase
MEPHDPLSLGRWFELSYRHPVFHIRDINAKVEMNRYWKDLNSWVSVAVALPEDTESIRIRKTTIALVTMAIIPINLAWTVSFFSLGLNTVAGINLATGMMFSAAIVFLFRTKKFGTYLNIMIFIAMIYSVGLHISLGGIVNSGVSFAVALLGPLAASILLNRRNTFTWAFVYVIAFTLLLALDEEIVIAAPELPANFGIINGFFGIAFLTFMSITMTLYLVRQLEIAQEQADGLLFNMLPRKVAARLKKKSETIADGYESASILFADIVGFTSLTDELNPAEMIDLLNMIYSHFDSLVEKHGVEKIRTIGDNYMVAAGVPSPRPDHAHALAYLALDMLEFCENLEPVPVGDKPLSFRIGINSGSLVAGVIGSKRFQYDIWGDAVNVASRMESHGLPGKIQVTKATHDLIEGDFVFTPRGPITVKGKGEMQTWFLEGKMNKLEQIHG